jgi:hypothetical protein
MIGPMRSEIRAMVARGVPLDEIESTIVEGAVQLSEDQRASIWLYAWGCVEHREQGRAPREDRIAQFVG